MIFKEKQNRILSVTVKVLNNYDNYKLKDMDKEDKNMKYAAKAWKETEGASLRNFNEQAQVDSVNGALALRPQIETIIDQIWEEGFDGIYFIGIGGTYASSMQVEVYMRGRSKLPIYVENAAEFLTTGNKRFTEKSVVIYSSVSGNTKEMVQLVDRVHEIGARVFAFIDTPNSILTQPDKQDYLILYPMNEQLKFYMTANYLMYKNGEFDEYDRYNKEMETYLADALVQVEKDSDEWAYEYAKNKVAFLKEHKDLPHYFIGSGNQYGATYSYAMCYWEEQMWIRTKSISCQEFFHGMQEIIVDDTPVTLFMGEDEQRPLAERVARFLPRVNGNYTIIDDAFNSNPVGSRAAVETLKQFEGVRILITPGMVELGEKEEEYNYKFGTYAADCCDYILLVGEKHTAPIHKGVLESGFSQERCRVFEKLEDALSFAYSIKAEGHKFILLENDLPDNY